ncbi:MAG: ATP synthase F1 subunit epsilon [Helicobacter sp.]|nr:ATP synthase F1 subunit epsilon [Helicobacter sp.]
MNTINVSITTPNGSIFTGALDEITLPGVDGEFGVLDQHSEIFTLLKAGVIEMKVDAHKTLIAINWGYARVHTESGSTRVDILLDDAVLLDDTKGDVSANLQAAKDLLQSASADSIALSGVISQIENTIKVR